MFLKVGNKQIGKGESCYLIAELSHNHQGKASEATALVKAAAKSGANAVKFQKRDNENLFISSFYNQPYANKNGFGDTYGEHRKFIEPAISWLKKVNALAHSLKMQFIMTVFDEESLKLCERELNVDAYKIQSADLTSHFLIKQVALIKKPYFISSGASTFKEIKKTIVLCKKLKTPVCLLYTVSEYPTSNNHVNLTRLLTLQKLAKPFPVGFSCHHESIEPSVLSRSLGAVVIEKHLTLNKKQKGPDHKISLIPTEFAKLRSEVDLIDIYLGHDWKNKSKVENYQSNSRFKMGKCAVAKKDLRKGTILNEKDLQFKSPMMGKNYLQVQKLIGKPLVKNLKKGEVL